MRAVSKWEMGTRTGWTSGSYQTHAELLGTLEKYPWLRSITKDAMALQRKLGIPSAVGGTLMWRFTQLDSDDARLFFDELMTGEALKEGDPVHTLRNALLTSRTVRGSRNLNMMAALICKAWNKYRAGEECLTLRWVAGGANRERFPEPE